jgi:hypothetical protein
MASPFRVFRLRHACRERLQTLREDALRLRAIIRRGGAERAQHRQPQRDLFRIARAPAREREPAAAASVSAAVMARPSSVRGS